MKKHINQTLGEALENELPLTPDQKKLFLILANQYTFFAEFVDFFYQRSARKWSSAIKQIMDIAKNGKNSIFYSSYGDDHFQLSYTREHANELGHMIEEMVGGGFGFLPLPLFNGLVHTQKLMETYKNDPLAEGTPSLALIYEKRLRVGLAVLLYCIVHGRNAGDGLVLKQLYEKDKLIPVPDFLDEQHAFAQHKVRKDLVPLKDTYKKKLWVSLENSAI